MVDRRSRNNPPRKNFGHRLRIQSVSYLPRLLTVERIVAFGAGL